MDDTTVVKVRNSTKDAPDETCGIPVMENGKVMRESGNV
jgi:hypothetical protein